MNRAFLTLAVLILCAAGGWNIGSGTWIFLKAHLAQYLLERAWAQTLTGDRHVQPWPWADTWPIARLVAPRYDIDMFILADASGRTLAFGPGHVSSSPLPGQRGTTILNGHRDTHFRFLKDIQLGDVVRIELPEGQHISYTISDRKVVDVRHARIYQDPTLSRLALITCFPFDAIRAGGPLRYVIIADISPHSEGFAVLHDRNASS